MQSGTFEFSAANAVWSDVSDKAKGFIQELQKKGGEGGLLFDRFSNRILL